ncbi:MAG: AAA family ATPase [Bacteroidaceae bacterium]|nr:AAA family ATPase [Bacteroidaceae bacterium]
MNLLAQEDAVCVKRYLSLPLAPDMETMLFSLGDELVLVALDAQKSPWAEISILPDPGETTEPRLYSEEGSRVCPAYRLSVGRMLLSLHCGKALETLGSPKVYGCLLSNNRIINYDDMLEYWEAHQLMVFHQVEEQLEADRMVPPLEDEPTFVSRYGGASVGIVQYVDWWREEAKPRLLDEKERDSVVDGVIVCTEALKRLYDLEVWVDEDEVESQDVLEEAADSVEPAVPEESGSPAAPEVPDAADHSAPLDDEVAKVTDDVSPFDFSFDEDEFGSEPEKKDLRVEVLPVLENPEEELDKLIGCDAIRKQMEELTALTRYNRKMRRLYPGAPMHDVSLHAVFQGAPGTGKTTLCKIYASLLHKAGSLSKGHVVVASRASFIGTRWGDEEGAVAQVLKAARGGVLMIDEAYQLVTAHPNDPGRLVLPLMMPMLADEKNRDIAVVLCGYKGLMQQLLDTNEGLRSRFVHVFDFPDFDVKQLLEIAKRRVSFFQYRFTRSAWMLFSQRVKEAYEQRDQKTWGNARYVANLLDVVYVRHAQRCMKDNIDDYEPMHSLTVRDVKKAVLAPSRPARKVGF